MGAAAESVAEVQRLARRQSYANWQKITAIFDRLKGRTLVQAVNAFEVNTARWGTKIYPFAWWMFDRGYELRRAPVHWNREVYSGQCSPKHRTIRILGEIQKPLRGQKPDNLLLPTQQLHNISQLGLDQVRVSAGFLKKWAGPGPWTQCKNIRLWSCDLKPSLLAPLARAQLPQTEALILGQNHFGDEGIAAITDAPGWTALRTLDLGCNGVGSEGVAAMVDASWATQVHQLNLGNNSIDDEGFAQLAEHMTALRWLSLKGNPVGTNAKAWTHALPTLQQLEVHETSLRSAAVPRLLELTPRLTSLRVDDTGFSDVGISALIDSGYAFTELAMIRTKVTAKGLARVVEAPSMQKLRRLEVSGTVLKPNIIQALIDGALPKLKSLRWMYSHLPEAARDLVLGSARIKRMLPEGYVDELS